MISEVQFQISNGPNKFDLMVSLFEGNKTPRSKVRFACVEFAIDVAIVMVAQEDGSGESWIFEGYVDQIGRIHGYYSSKRRKGWYKAGAKGVI